MAHTPVAERRRQFVRATTKVVTKHGVTGATTRRIAEEAGAPLASLHYCFKNKDELMEAVYDYVVGDFIGAVRAATADSVGVADAVAAACGAAWARMGEDPEEQVATWELVLHWLRLPGEAGRSGAAYEAYAAAMTEILTAAAERADEGPLPEAETLARLVVAGMEGITLQYVAGCDRNRADELVTTLVRAVGLLREAPASSATPR
ncbi:TetR/AcrR family transcriptional regulator [Streptomyces sp. NPDC002795]|uniref:TetR/AcrR family transcriptional regulator n=1 Tax=Streptomyces sp. NPDC002795 TaxID=3364665 RepID=UPI003694761C